MVNGAIPNSYEEALKLLQWGEFEIIAGGTDLMVKKGNIVDCPNSQKNVLFIAALKELDFIRKENYDIHIGANVTLNNIMNCTYIPIILKKAVYNMASPAIKNIATIGGNIVNASPAGDSLPALYLLDAKIVLESYKGKREISIEDFILGPGETALESNEIIKEIIVKEEEFDNYFYEKVGGRKADAISKVSFTGVTKIEDNVIKDFRVAFGAVAPRVIRDRNIENKIKGMSKDLIKENIQWISKDYISQINPIDDQRSTADYRKTCSINLLKYFINNI